jgi:hypothetical protein
MFIDCKTRKYYHRTKILDRGGGGSSFRFLFIFDSVIYLDIIKKHTEMMMAPLRIQLTHPLRYYPIYQITKKQKLLALKLHNIDEKWRIENIPHKFYFYFGVDTSLSITSQWFPPKPLISKTYKHKQFRKPELHHLIHTLIPLTYVIICSCMYIIK